MSNLPLIQPVQVIISPIDRTNTKYHASAREPVKTVARTSSVTITAQQSQSKRDSQSQMPGGSRNSESGYLVTRQWILDAAGYEPQKGDMITSIAGISGKTIFITELENSGHLSGANTLVLIYYSDRRPGRS